MKDMALYRAEPYSEYAAPTRDQPLQGVGAPGDLGGYSSLGGAPLYTKPVPYWEHLIPASASGEMTWAARAYVRPKIIA